MDSTLREEDEQEEDEFDAIWGEFEAKQKQNAGAASPPSSSSGAPSLQPATSASSYGTASSSKASPIFPS